MRALLLHQLLLLPGNKKTSLAALQIAIAGVSCSAVPHCLLLLLLPTWNSLTHSQPASCPSCCR
jgi:hypothetical protein